MKKAVNLVLAFSLAMICRAQISYDSVTISRLMERFIPAWPAPDSITNSNYTRFLREERTIWIKPGIAGTILPAILQLTEEIRLNGEGSVTRCFTPRHSVNYYREGRIVLYLLVCFECDALLFSDKVRLNFLKSREVRMKQMDELRIIFKEIRKQ